jgi:hypothetical protein
MIEQASLVIGNCNWANKEGSLLGYKLIDGKYYAREIDAVRATTATRINAQGLVELVPYNLLRNSQDFTSVWAYDNNTPSANTIAAPDGTLTADTIVNNNTNAFHRYYQGPLSNLGEPQTISFSVYLKYKDHQYTSFGVTDDSNYRSQVVVDLMNGTITENYKSSGLDTLTSTITSVGNGWYRVTGTLTYATALDGGNAYVLGMLLNQSTFATAGYVGSGTGIYIWGAQLVEGSTAKDYQKTETRLNIPRLDYSNGTCPSLLVEPQRTNLWYYSEQFDNAEWLKTELTVTANSVISPDGTQNADKITDTTANNEHRIRATSSLFIITTATTLSIFAKAAEYTRFAIANLSSSEYVKFNLSTGSVISTGANFSNAKIENYGNGWYRLSATTSTSGTYGYGLLNDAGDFTFTGTGTKGVYIWGAQAELGSYPTSYIPTTSASVTRNADSIGKNPCAQAESAKTWFADADLSYLQINGSNSCMVLTIRGGSYEGYFRYFVNNQLHFQYTNPTSSVDIALSNAIPTNTTKRLKMAARIEDNNFAFYVNGVQIGTNVVATKATGLNILELGNYSNIAQYQLSDGINAIALWDEALTNTQLAELTTL